MGKRHNHTEKELAKTTAMLERLRVSKQHKKHHPKKEGFSGKGAYVTGATYTGHGKYAALRKGLVRSLRNVGNTVLHSARDQGVKALTTGFLGAGSYSDPTVTNELMTGGTGHVKTLPMTFHTKRNDETDIIEVTCREYVTDLIGPTVPFNVQTYFLNPGLASVCPKLAQFAANFDMHRLKKMVVIYQSTTTDIGSSTNGQCGVIVIGGSPNVTIPPYTSKRAMLDAKGAVSAKTTENCIYGFECDPAKGGREWLYSRYLPVLVGQDQKTYDTGCIQIAVSNSPAGFANQQLGELFFEYTWELKDCNLRTGLGWVIPRDIYVTPTPGAIATGVSPFGGAGGLVYSALQNSIETLLTPTSTGATILFPNSFEGAVAIRVVQSILATVAGGVLQGPALTTSGNFLQLYDLYDASGDPNAMVITTPVATGTLVTAVNANVISDNHYYITPAAEGTNNYVTITSQSFTTSLVKTYVEVTQYNSMGLTEPAASGVLHSPPLTFVNNLSGTTVGGASL